MIEPISGKGVNRVNGVCDDCGRKEAVACDYERASGWKWLPNEGQALKKLTAHGWAIAKNRLRCPKCEFKRKAEVSTAHKDQKMEKPATPADAKAATDIVRLFEPLRQPTPKQKREIIALLEGVYDDDAKRYKGAETDKTVAETLGNGVMPGWVAEIREEMFGPDGSNEEMDQLIADMNAWKREISEEIEAYHKQVNDRIQKEVSAFQKRLEVIKSSVGPKAARA